MTRFPSATLAAGLAACGLLAIAPGARRAPLVVFNTTTSAPVGFYRIDPAPPRIGDLVVVRPPPDLERWMAARRYLPSNVPLIKRLAAQPGQVVCVQTGVVSIDGRRVAQALAHDRLGRRLHPFDGCQRLQAEEIFLLNAEAPLSLDSRYFGPLPRHTIVGRATAVWTWDAP